MQEKKSDERPPDARPGIVDGAPPPPRKSEREGIALCLSGGGFRASLFHLGALRRLHEVGLLARVRTISSVSGGSIISGYVAGRMIELGMNTGSSSGMKFGDWDKDVAQGFRQIAQRDLRTWPVLAHLGWNWLFPGPRVRHMMRRYRDRVTARRLEELPDKPEFVFCATDVVFGVNWVFRKDKAGDYQAGYVKEPKGWPIALAIACSASFPPIFGPAPLRLKAIQLSGGDYSGAGREALCCSIGLSDGGVYDNMALEPAWKDHEYVLVSDCGAPFGFTVARTYLRRLLRYSSVVMNQAAAMRKRAFFADIAENDPDVPPRYKGAYWGIAGSVARYQAKGDGATGYSDELVAEVIEQVRTDLDRFTEAEICVLENHGYLLTAAVLKRRRPELVDSGAAPVSVPHPQWMDEKKVREAMKDSHKRFSLRRLLGR